MWMWKDKYRSEEETLEVAWPCVACVAGAKRGEGSGDLQEARKVNADREGGRGTPLLLCICCQKLYSMQHHVLKCRNTEEVNAFKTFRKTKK